MSCYFQYDARLGIEIPVLEVSGNHYPPVCELIFYYIGNKFAVQLPDRIMKLEATIIYKQNQLDKEDDFPTSCRLNSEIADLASIINDLHLWFRANQELESKTHQ